LTLADEEMKAAEVLLETLPRQSAFFQQQAAEKLLRAVLEIEGVPVGPTHNLRTLTDLLEADHALRNEFLLVDEWGSAATRFRYPGGSGDAPSVSQTVLRGRQTKLSALQATVAACISRRANEEPSR